MTLKGLALVILAYLLPSSYLFEQDLEQKQRLQTLQVTQTMQIVTEEGVDDKLPKIREHVRIVLPTPVQKSEDEQVIVKGFRRDTAIPITVVDSLNRSKIKEFQREVVFSQGLGMTHKFTNGEMKASQIAGRDILFLYYLHRSPLDLMNTLSRLGYHVQERVLDRIQDKVVYRIGNSETGDVIWFDKQVMHPVGFTFSRGRFRIVWADQNLRSDDAFYPQRWLLSEREKSKDGGFEWKPLLMGEASNIAVNRSFDEDWHDIEKMKAKTQKREDTSAALLSGEERQVGKELLAVYSRIP